ncbi:MAG: GNAT family N-acetyltransferase, partial [Longimicrobiales bacterium]
AFARALVAQRDQWDVLHLYEQPPASTVITALARSLRGAGYLVGQLPDSICPFIRTAGDWDAFLDSRSRSLRKNLQRGRRRLEREGPVEYRIVDHAPAACQAFDQYLDIEGRSWKANSDAGVRADAVDQSFYRCLTALLGPDRLIEFRFIDVAGQPVAGTFGIRHDQRFYSLKIAHDQRFAAASPGTLLESLEIRDCFDRDVVEYDFLGGFLTNKNRWTDDTRETVQVFAFPRRGHWIPFYVDRFVVRPRVKRLLRRAGWLDPLLAWRERVVRRIRKQEPH